jgi:phosphatidylinositol glycan class N
MAVLLIGKITMPFFIIACMFSLILYADRDQLPERVSVLLFIISDFMAMIFYHFLKDNGSWLEIGISISNYVICLAMAVIFFILFHFSNKIFPFKLLNLYNVKALDDNKVL